MDDATSKVTTSLGNDKTDDDPISSYPTSDSKAGANLTFQGYDDGFDDTVHDDAFSVDDALGNGEYSNQVETALTGSSGAEFIPQQSAGSSNFDFGGKEDDFASKSSTNTDFGSSLSDLNLSNGDDFTVGDSVRNGDDFQSIIDGISTSIIKFSPSNHTSSNLTSLINNTESINYTNESSNLNYSAPVSTPLYILQSNCFLSRRDSSVTSCFFILQLHIPIKSFNRQMRQVTHRQLMIRASL